VLDYVDNFLILFVDKPLLSDKGIKVKKYVRRTFYISSLCFTVM